MLKANTTSTGGVTSQRQPKRRGADRSHAGPRSDEGIELYFAELDQEQLMDAAQERQVAERIQRLRRDYWEKLLGYAPFIEAMLAVIGESLESNGRKAKTMKAMTKAAAVLRGRPRTQPRLAAESTRAKFADEMGELDPSVEIADRIVADLEAMDAGQGRNTSLGVRSPARGSATFQRYLHSVRAARMAHSSARHQMVRANLRLVVTMAHRYRRNGRMPLSDLIQEGNLGLMTAVDRFDPRKGFRFSTYGSWWIRHAIGRALSDKGRAVRLPVHVVELQHKMVQARREFEIANQRVPDRTELAQALGVAEEKLERLERTLTQRDASFDEPDREGVARGIEVIADEGPSADHLLHDTRLDDALGDALETLRPMEADILRHRFGLDGAETLTLRQVGELHGLSRERIRQLQERALTKIRGALEDAGFRAHEGLLA
ncbi:MAG: RNA polymerase sigma factor RpoD/SigA [Myxococcota bacterium]